MVGYLEEMESPLDKYGENLRPKKKGCNHKYRHGQTLVKRRRSSVVRWARGSLSNGERIKAFSNDDSPVGYFPGSGSKRGRDIADPIVGSEKSWDSTSDLKNSVIGEPILPVINELIQLSLKSWPVSYRVQSG